MDKSATGPRELLPDAYDRRRTFCEALQNYADAVGTTRQPRLLEAIIRTSRGIADDQSAFGRADTKILHGILDRYRALHPNLDREINTYADAYSVLKLLFF